MKLAKSKNLSLNLSSQQEEKGPWSQKRIEGLSSDNACGCKQHFGGSPKGNGGLMVTLGTFGGRQDPTAASHLWGNWGDITEGNLEVKLPTIWTNGKAEVGRVREEKSRGEKIRERKSQENEDAGARKGRKVAAHYVFPMICGRGGSKSRLPKAAGAEPSGQMRDEKLPQWWRKTHLQVKKVKTPHLRSAFGSWDVETSARCCGAKHISKSKVLKTDNLGPLFEVEMLKKWSPLWRQAHLYKAVSKHFWKLRCRKSARHSGVKHVSKSK